MNRTLIQSLLTIVVACSTSLGLGAGNKPYVIRNHELSSKVLEIRDYVTSQGGSVVELTPEKDLVVWLPDDFDPSHSSYTIVPYTVGLAPYYQSHPSSRDEGPFPTLSPEEFAKLRNKHGANRSSETRRPSPAVEPNPLSQCRAMLRGEVNLPSAADNSLSKYFPPITYQIGSSCVDQAQVYYPGTYFNAMVRDISASQGELDAVYNPYYESIPRTEYDPVPSVRRGAPYSFYPHEYNYEDLNIMTQSQYASLIPTGQATRRALDDVVIDCYAMDYSWDHVTDHWLYTDNELHKIKQRLANGEILELGSSIGEWLDEVDKGPVVYKVIKNHLYGHAMTLVGYDDNKAYTLDNGTVKKGALLVANSWGNQWGKSNSLGIHKGYVWIAYDIFKTDIGDTHYYTLKKDDEWRTQLTMKIVLDLSAQPYCAVLCCTTHSPFVLKAFDDKMNLVWKSEYTFNSNLYNTSPYVTFKDYQGYINISKSIEKLPIEKLTFTMELFFPEYDGVLPFVGSLTIKKLEMYKLNASYQDECIFTDHTVRTLLPGGSPVTVKIKPSSSPMVLVDINPDTASVPTMGTKSFTATVTGAANQTVTWSCTPGGGTISDTGLYTAPSTAGTYKVTATSKADPTKSASATVTVTAVSVGITISPASVAMALNATQVFTATVTGTTNKEVTWSCTPGGGTVSPTGLYTAPSAAGTYAVTATSKANPTKSVSAKVTVITGGSGVIFNEIEPNDTLSTANTVPDTATTIVGFISTTADQDRFKISVGAGEKLTIDMTGPAGKDYDLYLYTSAGTLLMQSNGNTSTERVSLTNTGTTATTYTILIKGYSGDTTTTTPYTLTLTRSGGGTPTVTVALTPLMVTLQTGASRTFTANVTGTANKEVTWSCTQGGGTVSPTGLYTAPSTAGTTTVTATSKADPTKSASAKVTVISSGGGGGGGSATTLNEVEPNDTLSTANAVPDTATTIMGFIGTPNDIDHFTVHVGAGATLTVAMTGPANKDYDLFLYDSTGNLKKFSQVLYTSTERVTITNTRTTATTYTIRVKGYSGDYTTTTPYTLTLSR